jgi:hypothetical protein
MVWSGRFAGLVLAASLPGAAQQAIAGVFRRGLTVAEGSRHGPLIEMAQQGERRGILTPDQAQWLADAARSS